MNNIIIIIINKIYKIYIFNKKINKNKKRIIIR